MFKDFLDNKNCFKLILGASNDDIAQIKEISKIYYEAGCRFFDLPASLEAIKAVKRNCKNAFICVSLGGKNDIHISKCKINKQKCKKCALCEKICPNDAVFNFEIDENKCIGCKKCADVCKNNAIKTIFKYKPIKEILSSVLKEKIDCIEFHISKANAQTLEDFKAITSMYKGAISVCLNRGHLSDKKIIDFLKKLKNISSNLFMIQADGNPMSGGCDDYRTTLQAVALAELIEKEKITPYIFVSGGTNSKTKELLKLFNIDITGISIGSFARKIIKNKNDEEAVKIAKTLINKI